MAAHVPRLYVNAPLVPEQAVDLSQDQQRHLMQVMRCSAGDPVTVFNGSGGEYRAQIVTAKKGKCSVTILDYVDVSRESRLETTLYVCALKRDAMNAAIVRATELGVTHIVPTLCTNVSVSSKQISSRSTAWQTIAVQSAEQCGRTAVPTIAAPTELDQVLSTDTANVKLIAHAGVAQTIADTAAAAESVSLLVGPEGGLTDQEVADAEASGWRAINMGPRILRAETVPATLLGLVQHRWGDL